MVSFFQKIVGLLNAQQIPYMLSGSVAMSLYVVPITTRDMDFVVHLKPDDVDKLPIHFKQGYYCDREAIQEAVKRKTMFTIIEHATQFKADFMILKDSQYRQTEFFRRIQVGFLGTPVFAVSVEDLLLSKLIWIQEMHSGRQMEDSKTLAELKTLDWAYLRHWIEKLDLANL